MEKNIQTDRIEKLKSYLKRLGEGESLEAVRKDFAAEFQGVEASEIMKAEEAILAEGTPITEVQKLCDVHSALFHGRRNYFTILTRQPAAEACLLMKSRQTPENFLLMKSRWTPETCLKSLHSFLKSARLPCIMQKKGTYCTRI